MERHWRWSRLSLRTRMGWVLVGGALLVVTVALPMWALATSDLNEVAGWANILALPVTTLGLALVIADRDRTRTGGDTVPAGRRPWMAPPLDRMVERPDLGDRLLAALTAPGPAEIGLTTGLQGAGGFGKTRLATWVCHRRETDRRFPGGLLWATVGQEVRGADLAVRINDLSYSLSGERPNLSDPDAAGAELGRLLDEREPVLLIVDDVWEQDQLRPFRYGGLRCTRLVTTRLPDLLPPDGARLRVDAMSGEQARALVAGGIAGLPAEAADRLADIAGRWPVLLNLINGALQRKVARGQTAARAASDVVRQLAADGPTVLDPARPVERGRAVAATMEAGVALLDAGDRERYRDLAVFPEDVDIPLDVLTLLWPGRRAEALCEELTGLGLAADYRLDPPGPRLVMHDVIRSYLETCRAPADHAAVHGRLVDAAATLLHGNGWWSLPADAHYLWRYLPYHLARAGRVAEVATLLCDLRWIAAKTAHFGAVAAVEADLDLADTATVTALRRLLRREAHVLAPIDPPNALGPTLASRLHGVPELEKLVADYLPTLPRPRLEPLWPLPDRSSPSAGHTGGVTGCAFSPDGARLATTGNDQRVRVWKAAGAGEYALTADFPSAGAAWRCAFSPDGTTLATSGDDGALRLWNPGTGALTATLTGHTDRAWGCAFSPDGTLVAATSYGVTRLWHLAGSAEAGHGEPTVLTGHPTWVWSCAFSPDGALLATGGNDHTVRLWDVTTGTEVATLSGSSRLHSCAFSPDGTVLATTGDDRTVRLWRVGDGVQEHRLTGHGGRIDRCAFSPDGTTVASASNDRTVRLWWTASGRQRAVLTGHTDVVHGCAFSPDGVLLASTSSDRTVRLWRVPDGAEQAVLTGHTGRVKSCAFSPDGALLATAGPHRVRLWRVGDGTTHAVLDAHTDLINDCTFSPDGTLLATASDDRTVRLWRTADGTVERVLAGHTSWVDRCAFSPDGDLLATAGNDGTLRIWHLASGNCRTAIRVAAPLVGIAWDVTGGLICAVGGAGAYLFAYRREA